MLGAQLAAPNEAQETLQYCQVPDPMAGEQTWPTDEEMAAAERAERTRQDRLRGGRMRKLKVPEGFSDYQAAWVTDQMDMESDDGRCAAVCPCLRRAIRFAH